MGGISPALIRDNSRLAAGSPGTRGIVMMAPAVRPIDEVLIDQMTFGGKLTGRSYDVNLDQEDARIELDAKRWLSQQAPAR